MRLHPRFALAAASLILSLGGTTLDRVQAAEAGAQPEAAPAHRRPPIRTVKRRDGADMPTEASGMPSAKEIFDFHPSGSKPDSWRQPFDIDVNDGPLKADLRRSQEALKSYHDDMAKRVKADGARRCGEMAGTTGAAGCGGKAGAGRRDPHAVP